MKVGIEQRVLQDVGLEASQEIIEGIWNQH